MLQCSQLQGRDTALWCSRHTGQFSLRPSWDLASEANPECLGTIMGLIGKINLHASMDQQLVVIREAERYRYNSNNLQTLQISVVDPNPLNLDPDPGFRLNLDPNPDPG